MSEDVGFKENDDCYCGSAACPLNRAVTRSPRFLNYDELSELNSLIWPPRQKLRSTKRPIVDSEARTLTEQIPVPSLLTEEVLMSLFHASICQHHKTLLSELGVPCDKMPHCENWRSLWSHISVCLDTSCSESFCLPMRRFLARCYEGFNTFGTVRVVIESQMMPCGHQATPKGGDLLPKVPLPEESIDTEGKGNVVKGIGASEKSSFVQTVRRKYCRKRKAEKAISDSRRSPVKVASLTHNTIDSNCKTSHSSS